MTIDDLRQQVTNRLNHCRASKAAIAGVGAIDGERAAQKAWDYFYAFAEPDELEAASRWDGEIDALLWALRCIDEGRTHGQGRA